MTQGRGRAARRARLSRDIVLQAALRLLDEDGLDVLTMRRLGQELDRDPMALYRYATNRAELLDGVVEFVLAQLVIPADVPDWQAQLRGTAHEFRQLALAHPNVVPLIVTRPLATPLALRRSARYGRSSRCSNCSSEPATHLHVRCTSTAATGAC